MSKKLRKGYVGVFGFVFLFFSFSSGFLMSLRLEHFFCINQNGSLDRG